MHSHSPSSRARSAGVCSRSRSGGALAPKSAQRGHFHDPKPIYEIKKFHLQLKHSLNYCILTAYEMNRPH